MKKLSFGSLLLAAALVGCSTSSDPGSGPEKEFDAGVPTDGGSPTDGGDPTDGGHEDGPVTGEEATSAIMSAFCEFATKCGQVPFADIETCTIWLASNDESGLNSVNAIRETLNAGKAETTQFKLDACVAAVNAFACDNQFQGDLRDIPACDAAFTGKVADGQSCITDLACASGSRCFRAPESENACDASCGKLGTKCRNDADCSDGKICEMDKCVTPSEAPAGDGESCADGQRCAAGLVCLVSELEGDEGEQIIVRTCGAPSGEGGPCGREGECGAGLRCNYSTWPGVCGAPPAKAGEGQPCDPGGENNSCAPGLSCVPSADFQGASCMKAKKKGESCTLLFECGGLFSLSACDLATSKCVDRPKSGACVFPDEMLGCNFFEAYCDTSDAQHPTCQTFKAEGATCTDDRECGVASNARCVYPQDDEAVTGVCTKPEVTVCQL